MAKTDKELYEILRQAQALTSQAMTELASRGNVLPSPAVPTSTPPTPPPSASGLQAPAEFYNVLRASQYLGPKISQTELDGCEALLHACGQFRVSLADVAYTLGTAWLETNGTMQPVREAYWLDDAARERWLFRMYDIEGARPDKARELGNLRPGDGVLYGGRGFAQVTGGDNYRKLTKALGIPFDTQPDLMLQAEYAAAAMVYGMQNGLFTGKAYNTFLPRNGPATREQFIKARPIINAMDRAEDVADAAIVFQRAADTGKWQ